MLAKYSVKKPYTIIVAVILIIVLGGISFINMQTDLLPTTELPYVTVITTYPGASPEKVEQTVTRPLEAALGTSSGLKNINSVSRENSSMIMLEFLQGTNMDSVMIELSGSIDAASAQFEEGATTPILMRISADMMPIVVASADFEGMDIDELSDFASEVLVPSFERIEGVASVTADGLIEKQIDITLDKKKIAELNTKVQAEIEKKFDENKGMLEKARSELAKGKSTLEKESASQKDELAKSSTELNSAIANLNALLAEEVLLNAQKAAFEQEKAGLEQISQLKQFFDLFFPMGVENVSSETYESIIAQAGTDLPEQLTGLSQQQMIELEDNVAKAPSRIAQIDVELQNINTRLMTFQAMKPQLEKSLAETKAVYEQIESGKLTISEELAKAHIKIENGQNELEKGLSELDKFREQALSGADLNNILTQDMIKNIIAAQNFNMPAGYINEGNSQHLVKVGDSFASREEIENMVLLNIEPVGDIRLSDIADVEFTDNSEEMYAKINGNDGIILMFQKQSTASTAEVSNAVSDQINELQDQYKGLSIRNMMDQGDYIKMITDSVIQNLLIGGLLAILILILFLRDYKPTIVIALSIPISLMFAVTLMYFSNVTINVISLSGLALGVGMLVDNSIVVIENIYRLRNEGMNATKAAVEGAKQVSGAIFASTLTTICVFLPIVFTHGLSRQLFSDMGLTIAYSLLASLLVSLTLVPAMGSGLLRNTSQKQHRLFDSLVGKYEKMLNKALHKKAIVIAGALILLLISFYGVSVMGTAFMPEVDSPQMSASMTMPEGGEREDYYAMNDEVMKRIAQIDAVDTVGAVKQGSASGLSSGGEDNKTAFYILLKEKRDMTNKDVEKEIYEKTKDIEAEISVSSSNMDISVLGGSGIQINIKGQNLDTLANISNDIAIILKNTKGIDSVETGLEDAEKETRIRVDKDKAMRQGLTVAQIYAQISSVLQTKAQSTMLTNEDGSYPVLIIKKDQEGLTRSNIEDFTFTVNQKDQDTKEIRLGDIAKIEQSDSLDFIRRENQSRYMRVNATIADGYNIGIVSRDVEDALAEYEVKDGYEINIDGENKMIKDTMADLILMIFMAVVFIYLIMVAQFQNLMSPFIVLFTLPLAFTGGLLLLWITGMELSVIAMLGFLVLSGIVVNNGIVFVDYVNRLRSGGLEKKQALLKAGITRIRPILMTALTTVLAMTTLAFGLGSGAEMMQPMAVVTIGGLLYATLLTLFIVPVMYDIFVSDKRKKLPDTDL